MGVGHTYLTPLLLRVDEREEASMGREDSGLALQGLAQRLEALERENERMRSENVELRHKYPRWKARLSPYSEAVSLIKMSWAQASWMNAR